MKMNVVATAFAEMPVRKDKKTGNEPNGSAQVTLTAELPDQLDEEARARVYILLNREAERIAQLSAVSIRDQRVAVLEAKRIAEAPKDRSHVVVAVGTKEPEAATVVRGSVHIGGKKMTAKGDR